MFIHYEKLNPCKCGTKEEPILDSDDHVISYAVNCYSCGQMQHSKDWSLKGAVNKWNEENKT